MSALVVGSRTGAHSAPPPKTAVTIVVVHGELIEGSSWRGVYDVLGRSRVALHLNRPVLYLSLYARRSGDTLRSLGVCMADRFWATSSSQSLSLMGRWPVHRVRYSLLGTGHPGRLATAALT